MDSQSGNVSLAALSGSFHNTTHHNGSNGLSAEILESTLESLLEKNSKLTTQLEKSLLKIARLRKQRSALLDVIVKNNAHEETESDDDDIEDISADDIDSGIESSDDESAKEMTAGVKRIERQDSDIMEPTVPKRRKLQPKRPRGNKAIEVPKDENGNYIFPVQIGRTLLLSLGNIIPNENFFNQNYIFPVGYSMQRTYKSMVNANEFTNYTCSIDKDEFDKPVFCIKAEDAPNIIIQKNTPTAAWSEVLKRSNELRKKEFKNTVSGPEYYGLSFATIKKMIQELPGADECIGYQWVDL